MKLIPPAGGIEGKLADVQANLKKITGHPASDEALMAVAQVQATCALVHAVRELTAEVRKLNRQEAADV